MIIKYETGDIANVNRGIILHGVNCQGVMGSGVAKALKDKYPQIYTSYQNYIYHTDKEELLGSIDPVSINENLSIINCFTQVFYGYDKKKYVSYDAIDNVFRQAAAYQSLKKDTLTGIPLPIYYPMIGSGLGGGNWNVISEIIKSRVNYSICVRMLEPTTSSSF